MTENFIGWGAYRTSIFSHHSCPESSSAAAWFLVVGLLSRISAGALGITMIVAIRSAKWGDVDSLETLLGFDEFEYLPLFMWIAIAGPGVLSIDHVLQTIFGHSDSGDAIGAARS